MAQVTQDLDEWRRAALEQWTDARIVSTDWLDAVIWFFEHSYADFSKINAEFTGLSLRWKDDHWLLVIRMQQDGIPSVGFISASTPTRGMWKLRKQLREESWPTYPDRYA